MSQTLRTARSRDFLSVLALLALFVSFSLTLMGQAISGDLNGTVMDPSSAVVSGATITAENQDTGVKASTTSGADGVYRFSNLPIGSYTLTAASKGFAGASVKNVRILLSNVVTVNMTLAVGTTTTTVEVTEAPPTIETSTAQLQTTFEAAQAIEIIRKSASTERGFSLTQVAELSQKLVLTRLGRREAP